MPCIRGQYPLREIAYGTVGSFETPNQELQRLRKVALVFVRRIGAVVGLLP